MAVSNFYRLVIKRRTFIELVFLEIQFDTPGIEKSSFFNEKKIEVKLFCASQKTDCKERDYFSVL